VKLPCYSAQQGVDLARTGTGGGANGQVGGGGAGAVHQIEMERGEGRIDCAAQARRIRTATWATLEGSRTTVMGGS
jgi:hypothetical protein